MGNFKKLAQKRLFLPVFSMILVMLINVVYDIATGSAPLSFFMISIKNGVLYGRLIDILNRGSEIAILAIGMTLVVSASGGTDISVGSVMSLAASFCCMLLAGYGVSSTNELARPLIIGVLGGILIGCVCGAFNGGILALGMFFGRTEQDGPTNPKSVKCMELVHELHDWFKKANGKNAICCRVLTKEFNMGQGEHKEQCIFFTGLCAWKVAQIVCRELGIKNLDEIDEPAERRAIADI